MAAERAFFQVNMGDPPLYGSHLRLAIDNLLDTEIVLATGEIVHANAKENSDLYWGLRGNCSFYFSDPQVLVQTLELSQNSCFKHMSKEMRGLA